MICLNISDRERSVLGGQRHLPSGLPVARQGGLDAPHEGVHALDRDLVADRRVGALPVVVALDVLEDGEPRLVAVAQLLSEYISFLSVAKNDSATALSWRLPVRPTDSLCLVKSHLRKRARPSFGFQHASFSVSGAGTPLAS